MSRRRRAVTRAVTRAGGVALAAALLLTGCAADVDGELRRGVADLTDAVNAEDADAVRDRAESLIDRTQEAVRDNAIDADEGARIIELSTLLRDRYAAREQAEQAPSPSPVPTTPPPSPTTVIETEDEEEETEEPTPPPATTPPPTTRPPSPRPTQAPPSPAPEPSPPAETVVPEVPAG